MPDTLRILAVTAKLQCSSHSMPLVLPPRFGSQRRFSICKGLLVSEAMEYVKGVLRPVHRYHVPRAQHEEQAQRPRGRHIALRMAVRARTRPDAVRRVAEIIRALPLQAVQCY